MKRSPVQEALQDPPSVFSALSAEKQLFFIVHLLIVISVVFCYPFLSLFLFFLHGLGFCSTCCSLVTQANTTIFRGVGGPKKDQSNMDTSSLCFLPCFANFVYFVPVCCYSSFCFIIVLLLLSVCCFCSSGSSVL